MSWLCNIQVILYLLQAFVKEDYFRSMQRRLVESGTGWALYLPKDILRLLGYDPKTTVVQYKIERDLLKISKVNPQDTNNNFLLKKINKSGNGYSLYLSSSIVQLLELTPEVDEVKYIIQNETLYIQKAH